MTFHSSDQLIGFVTNLSVSRKSDKHAYLDIIQDLISNSIERVDNPAEMAITHVIYSCSVQYFIESQHFNSCFARAAALVPTLSLMIEKFVILESIDKKNMRK